MDDFGLNNAHQELLNQYMQFARYERNHNVKSVQQSFQDVMESRLLEATYTADEVRKMLQTLSEVVCGEVETDLMLFAHNIILLLQQLCTQAEKWHLRLHADISELHNQDMLLKVKHWEEDFGKVGTNRKPDRLKPMVTDTQLATFVLRQQLQDLQKENDSLKTSMIALQSKIQQTQEQRDKLVQNLTTCQKELEKNTELMTKEKERDESAQFQEVETKVSELAFSLQESTLCREQTEEQLNATEERLKQVQSQLQLAQLELERKFSETAAYTNMKKMITKKNDQMKELRKRLQKYEEDTGDIPDGGHVDVTEEAVERVE